MSAILITGAGLIGSAAARLCAEHQEVHLLDHVDRSREISAIGLPIEFHQMTLDDRSGLQSLIAATRPTAIVHTAALLGPGFKSDPAAGYRVNIAGTVELATLALRAGVSRFVFASSLAVYDFDQQDCLLSEDSPKTHDDEYGFAKLFLEEWLLRARVRGLSPVILRFAGVYGPGPETTGGWSCGRLRNVARALASGENVDVDEQLFGTNEYLHVDDAAAAVAKAVAADQSAVCNIGSGTLTTVSELVDAFNFATKSGKAVLREGSKEMPAHLRRQYPLDIRRAARVLSYAPRVSVQAGLGDLIAGYSNQNPEKEMS